ncbi:MAG: cellulose biosynthesis protein BcsE [Burkholderiaceae bacterium]|nr:cellulose biosynthesis protein BcsE [Burkholderiaceae bacterium]
MTTNNTASSRALGALSPAKVAPLVWWRRPATMLRSLVRNRPHEVQDPPGGLGIDGLPSGVDSLPCGSPVALISGDAGGYLTWMPALLVDAVAAGPVFLLAGHQKWVDALLTYPPLQQAYANGQLQVWLMGPGATEQTRTHGLTPMVDDLAQAGLTKRQAVFWMPANALLTGQDMHQLHRTGEQLRHWCRGRGRPVVLCLAPTREDDGAAGMVRGMRNVFLHVASMGVEMGRPGLYLERWDGAQGAIFDERYGLAPKDNGMRLGYNGSLTKGAVPELAQAPDQFDVIATRAVVAGKKGVPSNWRIVETDNDLAAATKNSIAATVLIDAGWTEDFEVKARVVHQLRLGHPRTLRILLRETQGKLRTHCEQALLRLGANAVLYKEMGFSRLLQFLQDSGRQAYTGEVHANYEQALGGFMPLVERGYKSPRKFCELVRSMLERTSGTGVGHCLVRLQVLPRVPHLDALRANRVSRDGDLMTADQDALYVFLFACREPDLEDALSRLFTLPLSQLFSDQSSDCTEAGMDVILSGLEAAARKGLPDHSLFLQSAATVTAPNTVPVAASVAVVSATASAEAVGAAPMVGNALPQVSAGADTATPAILSVHRKAIGKRVVSPSQATEPEAG